LRRLDGAAIQESQSNIKYKALSGSSLPVKSDGVPIPGMIALKGFKTVLACPCWCPRALDEDHDPTMNLAEDQYTELNLRNRRS
jgi:hypothetical protein